MYQPVGCFTSPQLFNRTMAMPWLLLELKSSTICVFLVCKWVVIRSSSRKPSFRLCSQGVRQYFGPAEICSISLRCLNGKFLNHQASKSSMWTEYLVNRWIFIQLKICPVSCKHRLRVFYDFYVMCLLKGLTFSRDLEWQVVFLVRQYQLWRFQILNQHLLFFSRLLWWRTIHSF